MRIYHHGSSCILHYVSTPRTFSSAFSFASHNLILFFSLLTFLLCSLEMVPYQGRAVPSVQEPKGGDRLRNGNHYSQSTINDNNNNNNNNRSEIDGSELKEEIRNLDDPVQEKVNKSFTPKIIPDEKTAGQNTTIDGLSKIFRNNGNGKKAQGNTAQGKNASTLNIRNKIGELVKDISNADKYFPVDTDCPYLGLQKEPYIKLKKATPANRYCALRQPQVKECKKAARDYDVESPALSCKDQTEKDLFKIKEKWRSSIYDRLEIRSYVVYRCRKNTVYVGSLDPSTGQQAWRTFSSSVFNSVVVQSSRNGFNFCLFRCVRTNTSKTIRTVLGFPPVIEDSTDYHSPKLATLNVNVIVLSSVSRAHFYRSLPETVAALRNIVYDNTIPATALDFEFLQSAGSTALYDLRFLLPGHNGKFKGQTQQKSGVAALFATFKKLRYRNILQTDQCWYERLEFEVEDDMRPKLVDIEGHSEEVRGRWIYFQNATIEHHIDDTGMSYLACEVLSPNNQLHDNSKKAPCLNGRYFSSYILDYIEKVQQAVKASKTKTPFFSYAYFTMARDNLGIRVKEVDQQLATLLHNMAHEESTLTIVTSDHGPKTTKYARNSIEGRYEIYDSVLFMVIPNGVTTKLGQQQMEALRINQYRLISQNDLHNTLLSIGNLQRNVRIPKDRGLLAETPENRTCADVGIEPGSLCKCHGWETWFPDNDPRFTWVAEFALGELNNKLQDSIAMLNGSETTCQRLAGYAFEKIYHHGINDIRDFSMELIVGPGRQVFETQVRLSKQFLQVISERTPMPSPIADELCEVLRFRRSGINQDFISFREKDTPFNLYLRDFKVLKTIKTKRKGKNLQKTGKNYSEEIFNMVHRSDHFGSRPKLRVLDQRSKCLLLITRAHSNDTRAFEVSNICVDRTFLVKVVMLTPAGKGRVILTARLPVIVRLGPESSRFLLSAYQPEGRISIQPKIRFKVIKRKGS